MKTILQLPVVSDWDGRQQLEPNGIIGLSLIKFNRTYWEAMDQMESIVILDGEELTIRRAGRMIYIERPRMKGPPK